MFQVAVPADKQKESVLTKNQAVEIGQLVTVLETNLGRPQDFEWAYEGGESHGTLPIMRLSWKVFVAGDNDCSSTNQSTLAQSKP